MRRLVLAALLLSAFGCVKKSPDDARPWKASAARAPAELAAPALSLATAKANVPKTQESVEALLDRAAAQEPTARGLREAARLLEEERGPTRDPSWAGSGTSPAATWLHHAGIAVLADLGQRASAKDDKREVAAALASIPLPGVYGSGGLDKARMEEVRKMLRATCPG